MGEHTTAIICVVCTFFLLIPFAAGITKVKPAFDVIAQLHTCRHPVRKELFLEEFWKCFQRLEDTADDMVGKAAYFRFLTLLGTTHTPADARLHILKMSGYSTWQPACLTGVASIRDSRLQVCRYF